MFKSQLKGFVGFFQDLWSISIQFCSKKVVETKRTNLAKWLFIKSNSRKHFFSCCHINRQYMIFWYPLPSDHYMYDHNLWKLYQCSLKSNLPIVMTVMTRKSFSVVKPQSNQIKLRQGTFTLRLKDVSNLLILKIVWQSQLK